MKSEISALFDDELADRQPSAVLAALKTNAELRTAWQDYQLIGDTLRSASCLDCDLTMQVMSAIEHEPVYLASRQNAQSSRLPARGLRLLHGGMRVAAALAGVGVVAWLVLSAPQSAQQTMQGLRAQVETPVAAQQLIQPARQQALVQRTPATPAVAAASDAVQAGRLQSYLVAHQAYSPANHFDGGAGYVRTVAATR